MQNKYTEEIIKEKIERLPLVDAAAFEILSLLNDPRSNYKNIIAKLSPDVTALFLNMANKASYGKVVRSVNYAMKLLGFEAMRQILITSFLLDHFIKQLGIEAFSFDRFQKQSHFCAVINNVLAASLDYRELEDLFTVSMLYNIGKLIIVVYFNEAHQKIIALKRNDGISTSEAECRILGISHADIGAIALERFNIPEDICRAVRYHNRMDRIVPEDTDFQLEAILREAARIVHHYLLPDEDELKQIGKALTGAAITLRTEFQSAVTPEMDSDIYNKVFLSALSRDGDMIMKQLNHSWHKRDIAATRQIEQPLPKDQ
jgi:HD-like signal output (HDOD) protein